MNGALIPAVVAAGGGTALAGTIYLHEHRQIEAMRASRERLAVRFPAGVDERAAKTALSQLSGLPGHIELVAETVATAEGVTHGLSVPRSVKGSVTSTLSATLPGLRLEPARTLTGSSILALRLFLPTPIVLRTDEAEATCRALLGGLSGLHEAEQVVVRWSLRATTPRTREPKEDPTAREREIERSWRRKVAGPGFMAAGLVLIRADRVARARTLAAHITSVFSARRETTAGIRTTSERAGRPMMSVPKTGRSSGWLSIGEVLPLLAWPIGDERYPGVATGAARELLAPRDLPREGRLVVIGRDPSGDRPVGISEIGTTHHQAVIGPSGVGKSTLLARNLLSDLARGHGGILIDPKQDLLDEVVDRVPERHADRIVVLDPAAPGPTPGVNALASGDPDLASDVILGALASVYRDNWGIRSSHYGRMALRTLTEIPGARLTDLGRLFADPGFRRQAVGNLRDPLMRAAWAQYEQLSPGEAATHIQPFMTKASTLLSRPTVRAVLASSNPSLDIGRLLAERKWLLISLSPGRLGEPAAKLLGSVLLYVVWSAIEGRAALPPSKRDPVYLYIDELATLAGLPFSFELLAERARGLGAGLVVAMQTISRLPEPVRRSLLGNVATLITFRASAEEAGQLARELPGLTVEDLMALGPYEVAARIGGTGSGVRIITGRTEPPAPTTGHGAAIRRRSAQRYGSAPNDEKPVEIGQREAPVRRKRRPS